MEIAGCGFDKTRYSNAKNSFRGNTAEHALVYRHTGITPVLPDDQVFEYVVLYVSKKLDVIIRDFFLLHRDGENFHPGAALL